MRARATSYQVGPRKRPCQRRSEITVAAIVEAAACILETHGFAGYTTNAVARRAGVSIGALYQYFPSKHAITQQLIERELQTLLLDVTPIEIEPLGRARLNRLVGVLIRHQLRRPVLARLLDVEADRLSDSVEITRLRTRLAEIFAGCMVNACADTQASSYLQAGDPLTLVMRALGDARQPEVHALDVEAVGRRISRTMFGYPTGGAR